MIKFADIQAAAARIGPHVERTPFRRSRTLSGLSGADVWLKFENLQFTASFKERGALNRLLTLSEEARNRGVIAMSAGNHAQGVAYHGARLGIPVVIVMPEGTPFSKIRQTEEHGAEVVVTGVNFDETNARTLTIAAERGLTVVHPYDDPMVMAGQGTIALEMLEDVPDLTDLVIAVGGGGLIGGMATAAQALKPHVRVTGVEVQGFSGYAHAFFSGPKAYGGTTIAEGIAVQAIADGPAAVIRALVDLIQVVPESDVEHAIALLLSIEKTVVEGAGAAGLAALLADRTRYEGRTVGLVLCGGNIDNRLLSTLLLRELVRDGRIVTLRMDIPDRPGVLSRIATIIGNAGGNIMEVNHQRLFMDISAKAAELNLVMETRGATHAQTIVEALRADGFTVAVLDQTGVERTDVNGAP